MTQFLKDWQEEKDKELWETSPKFLVFNKQSGSRWLNNALLESYIHSREEALLKRIGEEVEKMKEKVGDGLNSPELQEVYNQALDDIKQILK